MKVEIWSDVVCPWCYIGKRRLEAALARFPHRDAVEVVWRAFELDPAAPALREGDYATRLAGKYGTSVAGAEAMIRSMTDAAAGEGLVFRFDRARTGNTFDAHRLLHLAGRRGVSDAVKERLLRAYFEQGEAVGDPATLVRLVAEAGLDADEARQVLDTDAFGDKVRADEAEAAALGISGVPFFVVDRRYGVSGAQPADLLLEVLVKAWRERSPVRLVPAGGPADPAAACEGDSCAV